MSGEPASRRTFIGTFIGTVVAAALAPRVHASTPRIVEAAFKPDQPWQKFPTRALEDFPSQAIAPPDGPLDPFGGLVGRRSRASGFFRTEKIGNRWWLVTPDGGLFLNKGVVSVRQTRSKEGDAAVKAKFGDDTKWAAATQTLLTENGFNGVGSWSEIELLGAQQPRRCVTTKLWSFMSTFGKSRGVTFQQPGHTGYRGDAIPVFDPEWPTFCDDYARQLAPMKDDPWLLGHFSDNELPLTRAALKDFLALGAETHGHRAASEWLRKRHGASAGASDITKDDEKEFLALVVESYFAPIAAAIRKHDPHHLFLGARFHSDKNGDTLAFPEVFRAAGPHLDVVSVNYYRSWTPDAKKLAMWERDSGKPCLITEWYAKALDSGMANTGGAGWLVRTQAERGLFYQHFALALLESRVCVGWHWFKYSDNDPGDKSADPSNRDSNKGIVTAHYEPYAPLLAAMKPLNERAYALADYFDQHAPPSKR